MRQPHSPAPLRSTLTRIVVVLTALMPLEPACNSGDPDPAASEPSATTGGAAGSTVSDVAGEAGTLSGRGGASAAGEGGAPTVGEEGGHGAAADSAGGGAVANAGRANTTGLGGFASISGAAGSDESRAGGGAAGGAASAVGGFSNAGTDSVLNCAAGATLCGSECVDTSRSVDHCGGCDRACAMGQYCAEGTCSDNACAGEHEYPCDAEGCANVWFDPNHCGACGATCAPGQWCENGRCRCADAHMVCDGACVHVATNSEHCGLCGIQCVGDQWCEGGVCRCADGQVLCNGRCRSQEECLLGDGIGGTSGVGGGPAQGGAPGWGGSTSTGDTPGASEYCDSGTDHVGTATWYQLATPLVHCSYPNGSLPQFYGAMNEAEYGAAEVCGACVEVSSGERSLVVQIVDECPLEGNEAWCWAGSNHIDLNQAAFQQLADLNMGVVDVTWRYVPCEVSGNLQYAFKDGSSIYWTGILIRNSAVPIARVEVRNASGDWKSLRRTDYNYWLDESGFGEGPYSIRATDANGSVAVGDGVPSLTGSATGDPAFHDMSVQLPGCN